MLLKQMYKQQYTG